MKKLALVFAAASVAVAGPVVAKSDNTPINAAEKSEGEGCFVRGGEEMLYVYEPECSFQFINKSDAEGELQFQVYTDKGTLPEDQIPESAFTYREDLTIGAFDCTITETATPGGQYRSNRICRRAD